MMSLWDIPLFQSEFYQSEVRVTHLTHIKKDEHITKSKKDEKNVILDNEI